MCFCKLDFFKYVIQKYNINCMLLKNSYLNNIFVFAASLNKLFSYVNKNTRNINFRYPQLGENIYSFCVYETEKLLIYI